MAMKVNKRFRNRRSVFGSAVCTLHPYLLRCQYVSIECRVEKKWERDLGAKDSYLSFFSQPLLIITSGGTSPAIWQCLMSVGSVGAIFSGLSMPPMTLIFGQLINAFGGSTSTDVVHNVSKTCRAGWGVEKDKQLAFDIAFFGKETTTGEVIERMSGDTILIQDAVGEKLMFTFIGGFAVAFLKGWLLTTVMVACIPATVITGAAMSLYMSKVKNCREMAYAELGTVIGQTIGSIRTVVSFTGEKKAITKYKDSLKTAYKYTVQQGLVSGIGMDVPSLRGTLLVHEGQEDSKNRLPVA
ncbi:hypothetical protein ACLOJK_039775 [Asimina triloba]